LLWPLYRFHRNLRARERFYNHTISHRFANGNQFFNLAEQLLLYNGSVYSTMGRESVTKEKEERCDISSFAVVVLDVFFPPGWPSQYTSA